jgi:predicted nucleotidyltransferase
MAMPPAAVSIPRDSVAAFCQRHHVQRLALFGSVLREDFGPDSDVDVLVEFEAGHVPGFLGMAGLELELSDLFGHQVDLRTPQELSRYFREDVLRTSEVQYAAG